MAGCTKTVIYGIFSGGKKRIHNAEHGVNLHTHQPYIYVAWNTESMCRF